MEVSTRRSQQKKREGGGETQPSAVPPPLSSFPLLPLRHRYPSPPPKQETGGLCFFLGRRPVGAGCAGHDRSQEAGHREAALAGRAGAAGEREKGESFFFKGEEKTKEGGERSRETRNSKTSFIKKKTISLSPKTKVLLDSRPDEDASARCRLSERCHVAVQAETREVSCFLAGVGTAERATASTATQTDAARGNGALPRELAEKLNSAARGERSNSSGGDGEGERDGGEAGAETPATTAAVSGDGETAAEPSSPSSSSAAAAAAALASHRRQLDHDPHLVAAVAAAALAAARACLENQALDVFEEAVALPLRFPAFSSPSAAAAAAAATPRSTGGGDGGGRSRIIRGGGVGGRSEPAAPPLRRAASFFASSSSSSHPVSALAWAPDGSSKLAVACAPWDLCYGRRKSGRRAGEEEPLLSLWEAPPSSSSPSSPSSAARRLAAFRSPAPPTALALPPRGETSLILAGLADGRLALFDARVAGGKNGAAAAVAVSPAALSHGAASSSSSSVRALVWPPSRNPSDVASAGDDGRILWWDARELARGPLDSQEGKSGGGTGAGPAAPAAAATRGPAAAALSSKPPPPPPPAFGALAACGPGTGRLLAATDQGYLLPVSRAARGGGGGGGGTNQQHSSSSSSSERLGPPLAGAGGHFGPVSSLQAHPSVPRVYLTSGDSWARVWSEDARGPLLFPPQPPRVLGERRAGAAAAAAAETPSPPLLPSPAAAVAARWSPVRPSIYYVLMSDGGLTAHDLRQRGGCSAPEAALRVFGGGGGGGGGGRNGSKNNNGNTNSSEVRATALAAHCSGSLLACGLGDGSVEVVEVGPALAEAEPSERAAVATVNFPVFASFFPHSFQFFFRSFSDDDFFPRSLPKKRNTKQIIEREAARERSLEKSARDNRARARRRDEEESASKVAAERRGARAARAVSRLEAEFLDAVR